jgi:NhaP-type Na+/H+ or K+/H+ antiporter
VSTDQVLLGVALTLALAVGSQILASRLHIPALIVLLPAGFIAGTLTGVVDPQQLFGAAFQPLVSLAVAVILYDAGLGLDLSRLRGHTRRVVTRPRRRRAHPVRRRRGPLRRQHGSCAAES